MPNTSATGGYLDPSGTAPLEDDALDDFFHDLIVGVTGLVNALVRPRWQPEPPKQPDAATDWCAFGVTVQDPDAGPSIVHDPNANGGLGQDVLKRHEAIDVLVSFYGPNAGALSARLRDGLTVPQNAEILQVNLMAYVNSDTIRQVPELVNLQYIKRRDLPLHFRRQIVRTYAVENYASFAVTVTTD